MWWKCPESLYNVTYFKPWSLCILIIIHTLWMQILFSHLHLMSIKNWNDAQKVQWLYYNQFCNLFYHISAANSGYLHTSPPAISLLKCHMWYSYEAHLIPRLTVLFSYEGIYHWIFAQSLWHLWSVATLLCCSSERHGKERCDILCMCVKPYCTLLVMIQYNYRGSIQSIIVENIVYIHVQSIRLFMKTYILLEQI